MNPIYVVELRSAHTEDRNVIAVTSSLEQAAEAIKGECERQKVRIVEVDGFDIPGIVRTDDPDFDVWIVGWEIDQGPLEVTVPELNELSRLLGLDG